MNSKPWPMLNPAVNLDKWSQRLFGLEASSPLEMDHLIANNLTKDNAAQCLADLDANSFMVYFETVYGLREDRRKRLMSLLGDDRWHVFVESFIDLMPTLDLVCKRIKAGIQSNNFELNPADVCFLAKAAMNEKNIYTVLSKLPEECRSLFFESYPLSGYDWREFFQVNKYQDNQLYTNYYNNQRRAICALFEDLRDPGLQNQIEV